VESLESKLERLTPEQRREVEDFVDFLIQRVGGISVTAQINPPPSSPVSRPVPPPFLAPEPVHPDLSPAAGGPDTVVSAEPRSQPSPAEDEISSIHEIAGGDSDNLTRDYMDYGQFEQSTQVPSPADTAVQRVKAKISSKADREKPGKLLDWID
jgi:hypothetical protein